MTDPKESNMNPDSPTPRDAEPLSARLRERAGRGVACTPAGLMKEAAAAIDEHAATISSLREENERLRDALHVYETVPLCERCDKDVADALKKAGGGASRFSNGMIDEAMRLAAERTLSRAGATESP